ncbi:MAG: GTP 3',8-cyclase MoaA [Elusimicrobiota bacterium]|nr:GTP 3',8-cyclase MoaA [Elusimicrobiota bacterium]
MQTKLIDNFNRAITYLRISVTDRCNLRCVYCIPEAGQQLLPACELLTYEELIRIIRIAVELGITKFRITGGEPLVRKDILQFIEETVRVGKTIGRAIDDNVEFVITTNGVLLSEHVARSIFSSGIRRINISLDTLDREKFKKISRSDVELKQVIDGIKNVVAIGFKPVKLNVVVMKDFNTDEFDKFIEFALENKVVVRFIEQMPFANSVSEQFFSLKKIEQQAVNKYSLLPLAISGAGPGRHYRFKHQTAKDFVGCGVGFIESISRPFCEICNRLRLTPDGKIRLCLGNKYELDIKSALRNGATDNDLKLLFIEAAKNKPEKYKFNKTSYIKECMSQIGG